MRLNFQRKLEEELQAKDMKISELSQRIDVLNKRLQILGEGATLCWKVIWENIEKENYIKESFIFEEIELTILFYPNGDTEESRGFLSLFLMVDDNTRSPVFVRRNKHTNSKELVQKEVKKLRYYFEITNFLHENRSERSCDIIFSLYDHQGPTLMKGYRAMIKNSLITRENGFLNDNGELSVVLHLDHLKTTIN